MWDRGAGWCVAGLSLLVASAMGACAPNGSLDDAAGPGGSAWKDDSSVDCTTDADCGAGETCTSNVCQMKRCADPSYTSQSPLGTLGYFKRDREIVVAETVSIPGATLGTFNPQSATFARTSESWTAVTAPVVDVAGGNFMGSRPESVAMAIAGSKSLTIKAQQGETALPLGFVPVAVASGDVDGDGLDEVLALSETGTVSACKATTKQCYTVSAAVPVKATDIAAGDIDGDGFAEAIVLAGAALVVVNFDSEKTGHKKTWSTESPAALTRIAMGDLDSDGKDDLVGLEDSFGDEEVHLINLQEGKSTILTTVNVPSGARDVAIGATGADHMMLAVLGGDKTVDMISYESGLLKKEYKSALSGTSSPYRLTLADTDGDSPTRSVRGAPKLVPGRVVPIAVLTLPPYSRSYSEGESSASVGASESNDTEVSKTVVLGASTTVSFGGDLGPIVEAEISGTLGRDTWSTESSSKSISIGGSFDIEAKPENDGFASGAVMLACACFHQYEYVVEDPKHMLGSDADGKTMDVFVPVGGQTSVWSTRRYNALAERLGTLPKINVPHKLGQVDSYPSSPKTLDGAPIRQEDMLFPKPRAFRTSDVASVDFSLSASEGQSSDSSFWQSASGSISGGAFGVTLSHERSFSYGEGYSVSVSRETSFSGHVPAVRNDPETPEDEFGLYGYSFTPIVYRHRYKDQDGNAGSFFVLTYAVGK